LVPEGSSHGCSITERANRAEVVPGLKNTFLMVKKRASSAAPTLITCSLSFWVPLFIACDFFFVVLPFFFVVFFPFLHVRGWNGNFSHSSPFLTIVLMLEDQAEKNIIRPASRNRPRLHLLALSSFVYSFALLCFALLFLLFCF
jgi:hypothetical protein